MKNLLVLLIVFMVTTACSRAVVEPVMSEEVLYSQNSESYRELSRIELAHMSRNIQIWTLDEYTAEQKVALFKDKMQTILDQGILSSSKATVIDFVNDNLNEEHFTDQSSFDSFVTDIQSQTANANFTDEEIGSIFFTIDDVMYENQSMRPVYSLVDLDPGSGIGGSKPCNMLWCLTCGLMGGDYGCESGCEATDRGCGWFLQQSCEVICN